MKNQLKRLRADTRGQDLIEYALMAGFVVAAAGAIIPGVVKPLTITSVRIICAILAGVILGAIVWRRERREDRY